jgi:hypothetical protein
MPPQRNKNSRDDDEHILHLQTQRAQRQVIEVVVSLLASLERSSVSCRSLLGLRRIAITLRAGKLCRRELERMIGAQLDKASLDNILIPPATSLPARSSSTSSSSSSSLYDVELVLRLVDFFLKDKAEALMVVPPPAIAAGRPSESGSSCSSSLLLSTRTESGFSTLSRADSRLSVPLPPATTAAAATTTILSSDISAPVQSALTKVGELMDKYLVEIAADTHLRASRFLALAESLPDYARESDDGLYRAIDIYLEVLPLCLYIRVRISVCVSFCVCLSISLSLCKDILQDDGSAKKLFPGGAQHKGRASSSLWFCVVLLLFLSCRRIQA